MLTDERLTENIIDHEVRIRIQERLANDTHKLLWYIFATGIGSILIPLALKYFHLTKDCHAN